MVSVAVCSFCVIVEMQAREMINDHCRRPSENSKNGCKMQHLNGRRSVGVGWRYKAAGGQTPEGAVLYTVIYTKYLSCTKVTAFRTNTF